NGSGTIDCDGLAGLTGYDLSAEQDHNSNQNDDNPGFDGDTNCTATLMGPNRIVSSALLEDGSTAHPHTGVCNSPIHATASGTFPAGGMVLDQRLILRV